MKYLLLSALLFVLVSSQCPLPGLDFNPYTSLQDEDTTGFKITVSCSGTAVGINFNNGPFNTGNIQAGLYSDNGNHPGSRLAISASTSNYATNSLVSLNFETSIQITPGVYWIFITGGADVGGCVGCPEVSNQQIVVSIDHSDLPTTFDGDNVASFGVGQLGYSMFLNVVTGTACEADWECATSGANYDFATCVNGFCACGNNFIGSAIPEDVCRCDTASGNHLAYDQNGNPNCLLAGVCQVGNLVRTDLCADYTQNYMFIQCNSGNCQCVDGFQGSATAADQCRCDNTLTWTPNGPVCSTK